ncbi:MAG: alpha-amylase family glycosyl hydrolase, partial [Bacteroidota bacterium]
MNFFISMALLMGMACCQPKETVADKGNVKKAENPFFWEGANIYFLLTDRFYNGDPSNDLAFGRKQDGAVLRDFKGGDIKGVTKKIKEGYFNDLGINAIWMNPMIEQIHDATDEGTGRSYAFHGYWAKDWTAIDPNFGTMKDYKELVEAAHEKGIRVIMDVVINHTGPVTAMDKVWPDSWVRTSPQCTYQDFESTVTCTLVANLPDVKTESNEDVALPSFLVDKWKKEERYEEEVAELDAFFERTGYPRAPRFYIMKWLTDYVTALGIDGFRVDTAKHTEAGIWAELYKEAQYAFTQWKTSNPEKVLDDNDFYMVGEVYNYSIYHGRNFSMGPDTTVDFYANGLQSLINFSLRSQQNSSLEEISSQYNELLQGELKGYSVLNYISSHDDGSPYDKDRTKAFEAGTKLLLTPGASQVYYGDETARPLIIEGAVGDATLRSEMNWDDLQNDTNTKAVWDHFAKLGNFRKAHPAVGAGVHSKIQDAPYTFKREFSKGSYTDKVVVSLDNKTGEVNVGGVFKDGET